MTHKILMLLSTFPSLGGVQKQSLQLSCALREAGHEVFFAAWKSAADCELPESFPFELVYLPDKENLHSRDNSDFLYQYIVHKSIDIVLNQGVESLIYQRFNGSEKHKVINVLHAEPSWLFQRRRRMPLPRQAWRLSRWKSDLRCAYVRLCPGKSDKKVVQMLMDEITQAAAYVVLHPSYREKILSLLPSDKQIGLRRKVCAIPNPVGTSSVVSKGEKIVLYAGRLSCADKGVDTLLRVWAKVQQQLPDWQLHLRGDGPDRAKLQRLARRLSLQNVQFLPSLNDDSIYAEASVFALTSRTEAQGLGLMEAQQAGIVPVAFELNEMISEMLQQGKTGLLVPARDEQAYAQALLQICQDDDLRAAMSQAARLHMQNYSMDKVLPLWLRLFDEC